MFQCYSKRVFPNLSFAKFFTHKRQIIPTSTKVSVLEKNVFRFQFRFCACFGITLLLIYPRNVTKCLYFVCSNHRMFGQKSFKRKFSQNTLRHSMLCGAKNGLLASLYGTLQTLRPLNVSKVKQGHLPFLCSHFCFSIHESRWK